MRLPNILKMSYRHRLNLYLDVLLLLGFVAELELQFTGLNNHELIGVALGVFFVIHILLHWRWIVSLTLTFFKRLLHESRLNYLLNIALFVDMAVITVSGILISRTLGLNLGLARDAAQNWERIHILASNFSLMIVGVHVALHWKWIANHAQKYLLPHLPKRRTRRIVTPSTSLITRSQEN